MASEPGREPGVDQWEVPKGRTGLGKPLGVHPSARLQLPLWEQDGPNTWPLWA